MTKTINIHGEAFEVSTPYAEGHTITAAEAKALNQVRAENIANNVRKAVKAALESENPEEALAQVHAAFAEYDKNYEFTLASARGSRSTMTPLEKEALKVAKAWLVQKLREAGTTLKAYTEANGKDAVQAKIAEIAEVEAIQKLAKKNLRDAEKAAEMQIEVPV